MKIRLEHFSVGFLSFSILFLELLETRLLSFIFWNHMVYLTISVALLGFGVSGSLVALFSNRIVNRKATLSWLIALFGLSSSLVLLATAALPVFGWITSPVKILFCYGTYVLPFIFSGAALSLLLASPDCKVGQLYAIDLLCAGAACFLFFLLLPALGPQVLIAVIAILSGCLAFFWTTKTDRSARTVSCVQIAIAALTLAFSGSIVLLPEPYKELHEVLFLEGSKLEKTIWTPLCRVDVESNSKYPFSMHTYQLPAGGSKLITQDGTANTILPGSEAIKLLIEQVQNDTPKIYAPALVYRVKKEPKVAVIGVGGGIDVIHAYAAGAKSIVGAELNPAIFNQTTRDYADFNGHFFDNAKIRILNEEGRSMLRHLGEKFDVIQFVAIDTFAALSSGAYVLSENYLYTVEALHEILDHLEQDGMMCCQRWNTMPPRESLRLTALACEALKQRGSKTIDQQVMVIAQDKWALNMVKNSPFTEAEVNTILDGVKRHDMQVLYFPKVFDDPAFERLYNQALTQDNKLGSTRWNQLMKSYQNGTEKQFFAGYPFLVAPTTDDSPFFFEYHQKTDLGGLNLDEQRGNTAGVTLNLVLLQSTLFTLFAIFLPLIRFQRLGMAVRNAASFSIYFASIGFGFMLIEVALIQKCVLFLGNPMYSLSAILATLLISAGIGSAIVSKAGWPALKVMKVFGTALLVFYGILVVSLDPLINSMMHLSLHMRIAATVVMLFPCGLLLGVFFPTGLQEAYKRAPSYIPWAWGINGCASVYGSFVAIKLAILSGFTVTLLVGAATYVLALLAGWRFSKDSVANTNEHSST